jgi:pimeloyl-ACP methyl ester carboxylesterase
MRIGATSDRIGIVRAMTVVFVHGAPVTERVWEPVCRELSRSDVVRLTLPGFGCGLGDGFEPTMQSYADWLSDSIADFEEIDVVGQDWGGLLVLRVLSERPPNVRSWVVDSPNLDENFEWHAGAVAWQTPGRGEQLARWLGSSTLDDRATLLSGFGVEYDAALAIAPAIDGTMAEAMLSLYRSADGIGIEWGPDLDRISAPGMCVVAGRDEFRHPDTVRLLASRLSARTMELPNAGHFWMVEHAHRVATELTEFWNSLAS